MGIERTADAGTIRRRSVLARAAFASREQFRAALRSPRHCPLRSQMKSGRVIGDCVLDRKPVALELLMRLEYLWLYRHVGESPRGGIHGCAT